VNAPSPTFALVSCRGKWKVPLRPMAHQSEAADGVDLKSFRAHASECGADVRSGKTQTGRAIRRRPAAAKVSRSPSVGFGPAFCGDDVLAGSETILPCAVIAACRWCSGSAFPI